MILSTMLDTFWRNSSEVPSVEKSSTMIISNDGTGADLTAATICSIVLRSL
jgi:hypothetical protein